MIFKILLVKEEMKIAVMQPYLFPYIGYFQMIKAVDKFVFYDDVNFIKKGWINRNRILNNGKDLVFTVPISSISQNVLINKSEIRLIEYHSWKEKFFKTITYNYKKAPFYSDVFPMIQKVLNSDFQIISQLAILSVTAVSDYLQLDTEFIIASESYNNKELERQQRLIYICKQESAIQYINAIGGQSLYSKEAFANEGVSLNFIQSLPCEYKQFDDSFVPWLSIIDVLMFNSVDAVKQLLNQYELV